MGRGHIIGIGFLGQIQCHQRGEIRPLWQGGHDPRLISGCIRRCHHRGHQIGHDDGAGKMARGFGQDGRQHRAIAQVQVPVVGAAEGDLICHGGAGLHNPAAPDHA